MRKLVFYLAIISIIFLPFQPFLVTVTEWSFFSLLRDVLVFLIIIIGFIWRLKIKKPIVADNIEWILLLFGLIFCLSALLIGHDLRALGYSLRYSFEIWVVFWSVRSFNFSKSEHFEFIHYITLMFFIQAVIGFLLIFVFPKNFLVQFGYSPNVAIGNGIWLADAKLPAAQIIPGGLVRAQSTMSGPIQFAAYLLVLLGLYLARFKGLLKARNIFFVMALVLLFLTFTRSAWIGLVIMLMTYAISKKWLSKKVIITITLMLVFLISGFLSLSSYSKPFHNFINSTIYRPSSSAEHQQSVKRIWSEIPEIGFWGRGVGKSGPASLRAYPKTPRAVENTYLRFYEELGVIGFLIFIWLLLALLKKTLRNSPDTDQLNIDIFRFGGGLAVLGISVAALFSDTWTEAIPMLYLGVILGVGLPIQKDRSKDKDRQIKILDIPIWSVSQNQLMQKVGQFVKSNEPHQICTVNAEFIIESQKNTNFKNVLTSSDLNTADGAGIIAAAEYQKSEVRIQNSPPEADQPKAEARAYFFFTLNVVEGLTSYFYSFITGLITGFRLLLAPRSFEVLPERLTGADLVQKLCQDGNYKIFFLGGLKDSKATKQKLIEKFPNLKISGVEYGGKILADGSPEDQKLIGRIASSGADILLVGFGTPKQEFFIHKFKTELNISIMIGVGGSIDFLVGLQKRAPKIFQTFSIEWLWRLVINLFDRSRRLRIYNAVIRFPWLIFKSSLKKT